MSKPTSPTREERQQAARLGTEPESSQHDVPIPERPRVLPRPATHANKPPRA